MRSLLLSLSLLTALPAPAAPPDAEASDPARLGWMKGAPPPAERTIRFADGSYADFPAWRWTVAHFRELMPTVQVSRGLGAPRPLPRAERGDIDGLRFTPLGGGEPITWAQSLALNYTDGIVVMHRGRIVYERYFGALTEEGQHGLMSVTKSFTGLLGAVLVAESRLDPDRRVDHYVPELAASAFGSATVRQLLDMTTGIRFSEDYADPQADVWQHAQAGSPLPKPAGYQGPRSYFEYLQTVQPQGRHGEAFGYKTANSDALGWVIARVSGQSVAELLSQRLWRRIGAEQDAYFTVDSIGTPFAGGGLNAGLRDLARVGELLRHNGRLGREQILPRAAIADIRRGGSKADFEKAGYALLKGWSYRNMWWVTHNEHGAYMARGVHGQALYIDPKAEMVIARFASHPTAGNAANDPNSLPAYHALAKHLMKARR
ncbi:class C beta-lactamase-related serine hydrolase [Hydrogenophaga borbori]|uniref:Class C beta-lactamase-related serine hydrolase n=1 Tax=Hydrogenophaga borbori TaxID=2294117 RepID=A0A372EK57_9BURK|nr:serine hydrolase [Hydrogenophaga borbori]RFP79157.1 class C beta-lactamase-related serine hydrolase [Hydrogenophaga borbori]